MKVIIVSLKYYISSIWVINTLIRDYFYEGLYSIKCSIFNVHNKLEFKNRREFTGFVLRQVNKVLEHLNMCSKTGGKTIELERIDTKNYQEYAFRNSLFL